MKKIILIVQNFFEDRDYERYEIDIYKKKGLQIEVWSLVFLIATSGRVMPMQKITDKVNVYYPKTLNEIKKRIVQNTEHQFLLNLNFFDKAKNIRQVIYANQCKYYELQICPPLMYDEEFLRQNVIGKICLLEKIENKSKKEIIQFMIRTYFSFDFNNVVYLYYMWKNKPLAIFSSTQYENCHLPWIIKRCRNYNIHTLDYDIYLDNREKDKCCNEKYIVYIDDAETINHADDINYGEKRVSEIWKNTHRMDLCRLFDELEEKYHRNIIIAGHPRVRYQGNEYGSRKIFQFHTGELVKDASFVIVSRSTAWNFIILYDKPVLFYMTSRRPYKEDIKLMEYYFQRKAFDIADNTVMKDYIIANIKRVGKKEREKYIKEYILGDIGNSTHFFEIVAEIINREAKE